MPKPITPMCGCDAFLIDEKRRILLICRSDNGLWALPGGCQELNETTAECAVRECREETGYEIKVTHLLGVWSSIRYPYVHYPHKENVFTHLVFKADVVGGNPQTSNETSKVAWFDKNKLPDLSDGHKIRVKFCFQWLESSGLVVHWE